MRKISFLIFIAFCFSIKLFAQTNSQKLKVGQYINEKLLVQGKRGEILIRHYARNKFVGKNIVLYRASERSGFLENEDSINLMKKTVKLLENNPEKKCTLTIAYTCIFLIKAIQEIWP